MQPTLSFRQIMFGSVLITGLCVGVTGCANKPAPTSPGAAEPARSRPRSPDQQNSATRLAQGDGSLDAQAEAYAKRLTEALDAQKTAPQNATPAVSPAVSAARSGADAGATIEWVDDKYLRTANAPKVDKPEPPKAEDAQVKPPAPAAPVEPVKPAPAAVTPAAPAAADLTRAALLKLIGERVKESSDPAAAKAMSLAGLALVDPSFKLDEEELKQLPPTQRELARQFHDLFSAMGRQIASGEAVDRNGLADRLNTIIGEQPLSIRTIKLCDRVRGFGVYEPLPGDTFLAGREQPMVVYIELDHFKSVKTGEKHQVKLSQELILFNEADGLAVWRQPEEQIVDESRNQRRDFYVVQPTRLPARLGVGKYVLKVRVRDIQGGTRDEVSLPINMVADPALVKRGEGRPG